MRASVKIVLPCRNEGEWLRVTIDSILETTRYPSFEIVVLANGDTVTDFSFLDRQAYREKVRLERVAEALGVGNCINRAVSPGDATYYAFLDAHCLVDQDDWIDRFVDCLRRNPRACMVQPEVIQFTYDRELPSGEEIDRRRVITRYRAYSIVWSWPHDSPCDIAMVQTEADRGTTYEAMAGGGMAVFAVAETFHHLGGYDPEVSGWYPETMDYCIHGWLLGYPMMVDPTIRIYHRVKSGGDQGVQRVEDHAGNIVHSILKTTYKYFSPRRRDVAETLFRGHGLDAEVDEALARIEKGRWVEERDRFLRERTRDDDWLFERFSIHEERFGIRA
jgi:GT2 family glycosyltransferase